MDTKRNTYSKWGWYHGGIIYEDTINGKLRVTTNLHGAQTFKSVRAAKIAITKWG